MNPSFFASLLFTISERKKIIKPFFIFIKVFNRFLVTRTSKYLDLYLDG